MSSRNLPYELLSGQFAADLVISVLAGVFGLAELAHQLVDPARDGLVAFDLAGPVAFDGVLDELLFAN
jgi:hypothetical protein